MIEENTKDYTALCRKIIDDEILSIELVYAGVSGAYVYFINTARDKFVLKIKDKAKLKEKIDIAFIYNLYVKASVATPKLIKHGAIENCVYQLWEFFQGETLKERLLPCKDKQMFAHFGKAIIENELLIRQAYEQTMKRTFKNATAEIFNDFKTKVLEHINMVKQHFDITFASDYILRNIDLLQNEEIFFSSNDCSPKNYLVSNDKIIAIDIEACGLQSFIYKIKPFYFRVVMDNNDDWLALVQSMLDTFYINGKPENLKQKIICMALCDIVTYISYLLTMGSLKEANLRYTMVTNNYISIENLEQKFTVN